MIPLIFQNGVPLWARVTDTSYNVRKNATRIRPAGHFTNPLVSGISDAKAFVNQAVYDDKKRTLIITVNGGEATTAAATITVKNLDATRYYAVERDGKAHGQWKREGTTMLITTPPLSATEESYTVFETTAPEPDQPEDSSCSGCSLDPAPGGGLMMLVLAQLAWAARRRSR